MSNEHILIVEDEPHLADLLKDYLQAGGFNTHVLHRGDQVLDWLAQHHTDLILLDLMLPGLDGIEVCKQVRTSQRTPIIMTTARVEEIDRLLGLELGADDYVCKPYSPREVVARVKAVLRRTQDAPAQNSHTAINLQVERCRITINDQTLDLTSTETHLLALLMNEPGRIFSRNQIMDNIYNDYRVVSERTIDSHVKKLRKKINQLEPAHDYVQSVYGVGYKYEPMPNP